MKKYVGEITVFLCWALVMIFEITGSRILWPYFWTSVFVWTSLIGIILWSLSAWYYIGGKLADKKQSYEGLSLIVFLSALAILFTFITKDTLLRTFQYVFDDIRIGSIIASIILFAPASIVLWIISPYTLKLKLVDIQHSWSTIGNIYALSTIGSITGTFFAGFFLIPFFWTNNIVILSILTLCLLSIFVSHTKHIKTKLFFTLLTILLFFWNNYSKQILEAKWFVDVDTMYNRIWIYEYPDEKSDKTIRMMWINNENHSSMYLESDELVNGYTKYYHLARFFNPDFKNALMFWWAGYSFPKEFIKKYPKATLDVVEIDPKITKLAQKYFSLKEDPRLTIHHMDGRVYLNTAKEKYDVIFWDAFSSRYSIPYQLTTLEAVQKKYDLLNENGVVLLNIISAIDWEKGMFLRGEYATYKKVFSEVYLFPVQGIENGEKVQNIMLVALKSKEKPVFESEDEEIKAFLEKLYTNEIILDVPIITDDYAPVDYYINKAI